MKNTGIVYDSTEKTPIILPEFAGLLPPLTGEQLAHLEADILENGCYSPIIVNENLEIVDGHNRKALCEKHGIPYNVLVFRFEDRAEAMRWAVSTQRDRRNLGNWELGKIALKLKPMLREKARANMSAGGGVRKGKSRTSVPHDSITPVNTRREMAEYVGISQDAMGKIMRIDEKAPQVVKDALDRKEISIHRAYIITQNTRELPEAERDRAAERALADGRKKKERCKSDCEQGSRPKSEPFNKASEKGLPFHPDEENVRCWIDCCGMRKREIREAIGRAHELAGMYSAIERTLKTLYPETDGSGGKDWSDANE